MALTEYVQWEVNAGATGASDSNGGGFDSVSGSPGTDYTNGGGLATIAYTDLVIGVTTTQLTSIGRPFISADVGNILNVTSGSGFTTGRYQIMSVAAGVATCDRSVGTTASTGGHATLGGSLLTVQQGIDTNTSTSAVAGNTVFINYNGGTVYSIGAAMSLNKGAGSTTGRAFTVVGYNTTRTINNQDSSRPKLQTTATVSQISTIADGTIIRNLYHDGNTKVANVISGGNSGLIERCYVTNWGTNQAAYSFNGNYICVDCEVNGPGIGFNTCNCVGCKATVTNSTPGFKSCNCVMCVAVGPNTSNGTGFNPTTGNICVNCVAYNLQYGFYEGDSNPRDRAFISCIAHTCATGFKSSGTGNQGTTMLYACAYYNCTTGVDTAFITTNTVNNIGTVTAAISCPSGDPFVSASGGNFTLSSAGKTDLKANGYQLIAGVAETGYPDIGAYQHQDSGSGGGLLVNRGLTGGLN